MNDFWSWGRQPGALPLHLIQVLHLITSCLFVFCRFYIEKITFLKDNTTVELFFLNAKSSVFNVSGCNSFSYICYSIWLYWAYHESAFRSLSFNFHAIAQIMCLPCLGSSTACTDINQLCDLWSFGWKYSPTNGITRQKFLLWNHCGAF